MRVVFEKRASGRIEFGIIYGGIALLILGVGRFLPLLSFAPSCAFKRFTGIACPTCGSTRAIVHLTHGKLFKALSMNPLITVFFIVAVVFFLYSVITLILSLPRARLIISRKEGDAARIIAVALLLAQWAYLIVKF